MTSVKDIYILISEGESLIKNDVEYLINKKIITLDDIKSDETLLVCISRDYLDLPNPFSSEGVIMIRDQLSNVFCPKWRTNSVLYTSLHSIMSLPGDLIPNIYFITYNEDIYNNLDYYAHLSNFEKRQKMLLLTDDDEELKFVPIKSEIRRDDIKELGILSVKILEFAGYNKDENKQVPGWIFQCANPWLTRLLDLYQIYPYNSLLPKSLTNLLIDKDQLSKTILEPIPLVSHKITEDIRTSIVESYDVRKEIYNYSKDLLSRIGVRV